MLPVGRQRGARSTAKPTTPSPNGANQSIAGREAANRDRFAHIESAIRARQVAATAGRRVGAPLPQRVPGETSIVDTLRRFSGDRREPYVDRLLTVTEVSRIIKQSRAATGRLVRDGLISSVTIGRSRLVRSSDLNAYVASLPLTVPTPRRSS